MTMRRILGTMGATLAIVAVIATSAGPASAGGGGIEVTSWSWGEVQTGSFGG